MLLYYYFIIASEDFDFSRDEFSHFETQFGATINKDIFIEYISQNGQQACFEMHIMLKNQNSPENDEQSVVHLSDVNVENKIIEGDNRHEELNSGVRNASVEVFTYIV